MGYKIHVPMQGIQDIYFLLSLCGKLAYELNVLFSCPYMQHIEDLTQEKFTLQRALEASRTLAESLASENSSLTDSYNQQVWS